MNHAVISKKNADVPVAKANASPSKNLIVGKPNDFFEREADLVADRVTAGGIPANFAWSLSKLNADPSLQRKCACGGAGECEKCKRGKENGEATTVRRREKESSGSAAVPPIVGEVLDSAGHPLDQGTRAHFESRFGHDFSNVRVHTDSKAVESSEAVNAFAYTVGSDVVFARGQYAPATRDGQRLLAHELAHVIQQDSGAYPGDRRALEINTSNNSLEAAAEQHAALALTGGARPASPAIAPRNLLLRQSPKAAPVRQGRTVVIRYHPGVAHDHQPTGRWPDVQADAAKRCATATAALGEEVKKGTGADAKKAAEASETMGIECACAHLSPENVARVARNTVMMGLPLAQQHLDFYTDGTGAIFLEDVEDVLKRDTGVCAKLALAMKGSHIGHIKIEQSDYKVKDFQYAFGAIDRLDFEVDRAAGLVNVWFQDRYEWHPVGFGYTAKAGDGRRNTNCVHAALVEMKANGAKDYWMMGLAVVPLSMITGGSAHHP